MEKEQIIKALEVCSNYQNFGDCDKCPAREGCDNENNFLEKEALSLVREREKRIEELENICDSYALQYGTVKDQQAVIDRIKADTAKTIFAEIESLAMSKLDAGLSVAQLDDTYYIQAIDDLKEKYSVVAPPANLVSLEDVSKAIKDYCCELIDQGKDAVEVTEFNADIQKRISAEIFGKAEHDEKT